MCLNHFSKEYILKGLKLITIREETNLELLHSISEPVLDIKNIQETIKWMKRFLTKNPGYGVAAPQFSILQRFFLMKADRRILTIINPRIEILDDTKISIAEHCFSCPGVEKTIPRSKKILCSFISENGNYIQREFSGLNSIIFQHEFDHLNGKLIAD